MIGLGSDKNAKEQSKIVGSVDGGGEGLAIAANLDFTGILPKNQIQAFQYEIRKQSGRC